MAKKLRDIVTEGIFRKAKTAIGHSLPNRVRGGIAALVTTGKALGADTPEDAQRYKDFRKKLLSNKHKVPKFKDS